MNGPWGGPRDIPDKKFEHQFSKPLTTTNISLFVNRYMFKLLIWYIARDKKFDNQFSKPLTTNNISLFVKEYNFIIQNLLYNETLFFDDKRYVVCGKGFRKLILKLLI